MVNIIKETKFYLKELITKKNLLFELTKRDFREQYMGSYLGFLWAFLQPILFFLILWFLFSVGFRRGGQNKEVPFVVYLVTGMFCWHYIAGNIGSFSNLVIKYSFIVKKVNIRLSILPIVKIISSSTPHFILMLLVVLISYANGIKPSFYLIQLIYYYLAAVYLMIGIGLLLSSLNVFIQDVGSIASVILQFEFWLTPVFWKLEMMPKNVRFFLKLNPSYYIVTGYRDSIIYKIPFWEKPELGIYYWTFSTIVVIIGALVFRKLRPHFAEVI